MTKDARISTGLPGHPKTKKLLRRLGHAGPLACIYLFIWSAANRSDGDLSGLSNEDIELSVDWTGEHGAFVSAMVDVGFLDGEENQLFIHDWAEHNPWAAGAKDRSEASRFAALCKRYGRNEAANRMPDYADRMRTASEPHTDRMRGGCEADAPSPSPSPSPIPLPLPLPLPKIEKTKTARGSRLPENFEPDFVFAVDAGIQNTLEEAAKFRDYWNSQPGQKGVKLDWAATWRNWCRNVKPSSKVQQSSETPYQRSMREKYQTIAPSIAAQNPNVQRIDVNTFFDTLPAKKLEITNG